VSDFRVITRTVGVAATAAVLVLGLFAGSALGWYGGEEGGNEVTTPTEETPTGSTGTSGEQSPTAVQPVEQAQPASPPPPPAVTQPAAEGPVAVATPTPAAPPQEQVKGDIGTQRSKGKTGGTESQPAVLAQAGEFEQAAATTKLARTGFDILVLAILGGLALAGSTLLFWRSRAT
jgi:hypothetical protein